MKKILTIITCFVLCCSVVGCSSSKNFEKANDIFDEIKGNDDVSSYIKKSKAFTTDNDPNELMGEENQYTSKVSWADKRVKVEENDKYNGGTIEFFNNEKDAKLRKEYLEYYSEKMHEVFNEKEYGELANVLLTDTKVVKKEGNAIIAVSSSLKEKEANAYFKAFKSTLKGYEFKQTKAPSKTRVANLDKKNKKVIDENMPKMKTMWDDGLLGLANEMEARVVDLENTLDEAKVAKLLTDLSEYNSPFFLEKYNAWNLRVEAVKKTIADNKKAAEAEAAAQRAAAIGQQNALKKANSYLKYSSFSYTGLIKQLEFEGFSNADSIYAVDHCGADWNAQAAKKAESYMKYSSFSRDGLIKQLLFEGFTQEQSEFGAASVGY